MIRLSNFKNLFIRENSSDLKSTASASSDDITDFGVFEGAEGSISEESGIEEAESESRYEMKETIDKSGCRITEYRQKGGGLIQRHIIDKAGNVKIEFYGAGDKLSQVHFLNKDGSFKAESYRENKTLQWTTSTALDGSKKTVFYDTKGRVEQVTAHDIEDRYTTWDYHYGTGRKSPLKMKPNTSSNRMLDVNGKIDKTVKQGGTGDCWLIAGIHALNSLPKGVQLIRNSITANKDGSVTVTLAGAGRSFKLTPEEIKKYDTDKDEYDEYSNGDNDMLVIELAMDKYRWETEGKNLDYGLVSDILDALSPNYKMVTVWGYDADSKIDEFLSAAADNNDIAACFAFEESIYTNGYFSAKTINGRTFSYNLNTSGSHGFTVTNIDKNKKTLTFIDPHNSSKPYTMTISEFKKLAPNKLFKIDLSAE